VSLKKENSQGKTVEVTVNNNGKTLKIFVRILSKNSTSVNSGGIAVMAVSLKA
jgi:hypothetical protein